LKTPPANLNGAPVSGGGNNGAFQLSFGGAVGEPYRILGSADMTVPMSNLINWVTPL
jgi:hypothetical protein